MHCKNCYKNLFETQKFCDECGAKVIVNRLTPKVLATQVNKEFISIDNKFFLTFIDLFRQPEAVIVGYINGTRKKYIDVLQYFAIALTLAGIQVFLMTTFFKESMDFGVGFADGFNSSIAKTDNPIGKLDFNFFNQYQGLIYILTLPLSALGTWMAYYITGERTFNFTEHLVLNLYYNAQVIIITAVFSILFLVLGLDYMIVSTIITVPMFAYLLFVLKRIFQNSFWETFGRFLLVILIYISSFIIIGITLVITLIVSGSIR